MELVSSEEPDWEHHSEGDASFKRKKITGETELSNQIGCSLYEVPEGGRSLPYHYHTVKAEAIYFLEGEGVLRYDEGEVEVSAGDYVALPTGETGGHQVVNPNEGNLRYLMVSTVNGADVRLYPRRKLPSDVPEPRDEEVQEDDGEMRSHRDSENDDEENSRNQGDGSHTEDTADGTNPDDESGTQNKVIDRDTNGNGDGSYDEYRIIDEDMEDNEYRSGEDLNHTEYRTKDQNRSDGDRDEEDGARDSDVEDSEDRGGETENSDGEEGS